MTKEEIESQVLKDHEAVVGKVILVTDVTGYSHDNSIDVRPNPPAKCRVIRYESRHQRAYLCHWNDDWCDPYWDLELVEPHPQLEGLTSLWTFGHSYQIGTAAREPNKDEVLNEV